MTPLAVNLIPNILETKPNGILKWFNDKANSICYSLQTKKKKAFSKESVKYGYTEKLLAISHHHW